MRPTARAAARAGLVGGATLLAAAISLSPAHAASADLAYSCDYAYGTEEGLGDATASFDSAIGDDVVVTVGTPVSLDPFTGSVTVPDGFTDLLRQNGVDSISGSGLTLTLVRETDEPFFIDLVFEPVEVPAAGPLTLALTGQGDDVTPEVAGTYTLDAAEFLLDLDNGEEEPIAGMFCDLAGEGDISIDQFEATAAPTPTATPTVTTTVTAQPTASPVRPVVVQTDFAGDNRSSALPLVLGGALLAGGVGAVATGRARSSSRRH